MFAQMDNLIYPEEKNFKSLRQITFGGDNAETYWDVNDSNLVFQSNNPDWGVNCDQIFIIDKSEDLSNKTPKMISTGQGRTTCAYFMPDGKHIFYASTHLGNPECPDAPLGLFYRGTLPQWNERRTLAIVGTRQETNYGRQIVKELLAALPKDILIVSGLAQGVDADVHEQALICGLQTIGVLGHGLDRIYPAKHRDLALAMTKQGGLLSEFLIGTRAERMHFPMRNRIIAGLSDAVVVIESKKNGGSLITAELANDYNREVCAFPGAVHYPHSAGCNALIKANKAHLINDAEDLLKLLNWEENARPQAKECNDLNSQQKAVIQVFQTKNTWSIDELCLHLEKPVSDISTLLFELELAGHIEHLGANRYKLPI